VASTGAQSQVDVSGNHRPYFGAVQGRHVLAGCNDGSVGGALGHVEQRAEDRVNYFITCVAVNLMLSIHFAFNPLTMRELGLKYLALADNRPGAVVRRRVTLSSVRRTSFPGGSGTFRGRPGVRCLVSCPGPSACMFADASYFTARKCIRIAYPVPC